MTHKVFEGWGGIGWSWVNLGYLLGGLFLLQQKVINWRIPTAVLGHCCSLPPWAIWPPRMPPPPPCCTCSAAPPCWGLLHRHRSGECQHHRKGRLVYGVLIGVLVYVIRRFGGYPDASPSPCCWPTCACR
jgi:electron transport complex protein RnfD